MTDSQSRAAFPHCDSAVLHSPGTCRYCDKYPDWQHYRQIAGINFTGECDPSRAPDPASTRRSLETINHWGGNRPETRTDEQIKRDWDSHFADVSRLIAFDRQIDMRPRMLSLRFRALRHWIKFKLGL